MLQVAPSEINANPNTEFGLVPELQNSLANGNAQFVINLCRDMKLSYTIPSIALHIASIFFHKKSYIHYDRFLILTAAVLLSCKMKDVECRLIDICHSFYNTVSQATQSIEPFTEEKCKLIRQQVCIHESELLRALEYFIDFVSPHEYVKKYTKLFGGQNKELCKRLYDTTRVLILDSYRCRCCLVYSPLTVFTTCLLIAARYEKFRPYESLLIRELCKIQNPKPQELYETFLDYLATSEALPLRQEDVQGCLQMMNSVLFV